MEIYENNLTIVRLEGHNKTYYNKIQYRHCSGASLFGFTLASPHDEYYIENESGCSKTLDGMWHRFLNSAWEPERFMLIKDEIYRRPYVDLKTAHGEKYIKYFDSDKEKNEYIASILKNNKLTKLNVDKKNSF